MKIETRMNGSILIATILEERFDATCVPAFVTVMKGWIDAGNLLIILDFAHVDFVDSTALGAMIKSFKWLRQGDGGKRELALCGVNNKIKSLLQLTRMDRVFLIFPDSQEATKALMEAK
jgi:anti-sigma B factor antagonist